MEVSFDNTFYILRIKKPFFQSQHSYDGVTVCFSWKDWQKLQTSENWEENGEKKIDK
jgi:hypothetical protein